MTTHLSVTDVMLRGPKVPACLGNPTLRLPVCNVQRQRQKAVHLFDEQICEY